MAAKKEEAENNGCHRLNHNINSCKNYSKRKIDSSYTMYI